MNKLSVEEFLQRQIPRPEAACLCGSGIEFGKCCSENIAHVDSKRSGSLSVAESLTNKRALLTRYSIWYRQHTRPLIQRDPDSGGELLRLDLAAMSDFVDGLMAAYNAMSMLEDFVAVLERLRSNIEDERWQRKITYFQALTISLEPSDIRRARDEIRKILPLRDDEDSSILQLYLELYNDDLSFSTRQDIIAKIVATEEQPGIKLQYECAAAIDYLMIGDKERFKELLQRAIQRYRKLSGSFRPNTYALFRYAGALELDGSLNFNEESSAESVRIFEALLDDPNVNDSGKADICRQLGELHRSKTRHDSARACFLKAFELEARGIFQIFLASSMISLGEHEDARDVLLSVSLEEIEPAETIDYAFVWYELASKSKKKSDANHALSLLRAITTSAPYFSQIKDEMIIALLELENGKKGGLSTSTWEKLERLTKYLSLKPGMFGLSIDFNKIIQDQVKSKKK
ncbi:UNVERIFIED_ORG: hypothetical protein DFO49_4057 [Herbaspirillum seropedicae]